MSKILIITNHSYMLYRFRLELIQELRKTHEVVLSMPFVGHEDDFKSLGIRCIETDVDRRGINPKTDWKLFSTYRKLIKNERPDMVSPIPLNQKSMVASPYSIAIKPIRFPATPPTAWCCPATTKA